jgi:hypothetical protein
MQSHAKTPVNRQNSVYLPDFFRKMAEYSEKDCTFDNGFSVAKYKNGED